MDILLWRWSTAVQLTSAFMIAVFFVALARAVRRPEIGWWRRAWVANFVAIIAALSYWYFQPTGILVPSLIRAGYLAAKMAFILLIVEGAWTARHAGRTLLSARQRWIAIAGYAMVGGIALQSIMLLGFVQHGLLALIFIAAAIGAARVRERGAVWLAAGLFVRALVAVAEVTAYGAL